MTVEERSYVKSAYASLQLAEMYFLCFDESGKFNVDGFDFLKLSNICSVLLDGYAEEVPIIYLVALFYNMWRIRLEGVCQFLLCVMNEVLKKTQKIRNENKTFIKYCPCVPETVTELVTLPVNHANLLFLSRTFTTSSASITLNSVDLKKQNPIDNGDMLMKIFEHYEGEDEFHAVPKKVENFDQAKIVFELILKLAKERMDRDKKQTAYDSNYFEGMARCSFAAFVPDPNEVYKLCEKSVELLKNCLNVERPLNKNKMRVREFKIG